MLSRPTNKTERLALRQAFIPKGAQLVPGPDGGAVYTYETAGKPYAVAFIGTAAKPVRHYSFSSLERRQAFVDDMHRGFVASAAHRASRSAAKSAWVNPLKVGEILYTSWGYDQTNVEFFAVTKVSGRRVWVREIAADHEQTGFMSGNTWPAMPIQFISEETMHTAQPSGGTHGVYVKISDCRHAWPEQGRQHGTTSYA
jgi:hypothetical protein